MNTVTSPPGPVSVLLQVIGVLLVAVAVYIALGVPSPLVPFLGVSLLGLAALLLSQKGFARPADPLGSGLDAECPRSTSDSGL